jgi:hypothetical protein
MINLECCLQWVLDESETRTFVDREQDSPFIFSKKEANGTSTNHFGGDQKASSHLRIMPGGNTMVCLCQPPVGSSRAGGGLQRPSPFALGSRKSRRRRKGFDGSKPPFLPVPRRDGWMAGGRIAAAYLRPSSAMLLPTTR